ncbi:hypothetical protein GCM10010521_43920 [Streptomyces rameus]|uniref:Uncharacterized protein n=1 Tax=Streptomyces rameus TaxID=68261 RepID=A0ABP6NMN7_9ACTN
MQLDDPTTSGVPVLSKQLVVDLGRVAGAPGQIQGIPDVTGRQAA